MNGKRKRGPSDREPKGRSGDVDASRVGFASSCRSGVQRARRMTAALTVSIFPVDAIDQHFNYSPWLQFSTLLVLRFVSCLYACLEQTRRSVFYATRYMILPMVWGGSIPPSSKVYSKQIYTQRRYLRDRSLAFTLGLLSLASPCIPIGRVKKHPGIRWPCISMRNNVDCRRLASKS